MGKAEIESTIALKIRNATEEAILEAISDLNSTGHCFERIEGTVCDWTEPGADESLNITCAIGVGFTAKPARELPPDPVVQSYIARAESGTDKDATLLNLLEGDIANGGFLQLYENKGDHFIRKGIALLRKIGSRSAVRIVEEAHDLIRKEKPTLEKYDLFQKKLDRLNSRFWNLKESIPALYERYLEWRNRPGGRRKK